MCVVGEEQLIDRHDRMGGLPLGGRPRFLMPRPAPTRRAKVESSACLAWSAVLPASNDAIAMMLAKAPSNFEAGIIGAMAAISALLVLRARRQVCDWSPSAPFHWERKRAAMADLTANDVMVITDFDATITTGDSEQCHDMVGSSRLLSDEFRKEFAPLLDWTTNANIDGVPWWDAAVRPTASSCVHRLALALASAPVPCPSPSGPSPTRPQPLERSRRSRPRPSARSTR